MDAVSDEERAVERVLYRYARAVDGRDLVGVRSCYWDDAYAEHEGFSGGVDEYCRWLAEVLPATELSTHQFTNVVVSVDLGSEAVPTADSHAYCLGTTLWRLPDGRDRHLLNCLSYEDQWRRHGGEWRITRRRCRRLWSRVEVAQAW